MATSALEQGEYAAALREVIQPYIQDNIPKQAKLLQVLKKNDTVQFFNNNFYFAVRTNRHGGVVNLTNEQSKLVTGYAPTARGTVSPKLVTATFDISDVVMKSSANDRGAVESAMEMQMRTLKNDFSKDLNRQYWSDGVGIRAQVSGSVSGTAFTVLYPNSSIDDTRGDVSGWFGTINTDLKPTKYLAPGQYLALGTAGAAVGASSGAYISAVTGGSALGTITTIGTIASVANDAVFITDGEITASVMGTQDIQGIRAALSVGTATTYAGITIASNDLFQAQYMGTAANGALTIADMDTIYVTAREYAEESDRYVWFMNKSLYTKYGELLTALRRTVNKVELVSGWSGLEFAAGSGNVPVMLDYDTPDGEAVLLNLDTWTVCQIADMRFLDQNLRRRSDYITYQEVFTWYTNLACRCPAANGRMLRRTK